MGKFVGVMSTIAAPARKMGSAAWQYAEAKFNTHMTRRHPRNSEARTPKSEGRPRPEPRNRDSARQLVVKVPTIATQKPLILRVRCSDPGSPSAFTIRISNFILLLLSSTPTDRPVPAQSSPFQILQASMTPG